MLYYRVMQGDAGITGTCTGMQQQPRRLFSLYNRVMMLTVLAHRTRFFLWGSGTFDVPEIVPVKYTVDNYQDSKYKTGIVMRCPPAVTGDSQEC